MQAQHLLALLAVRAAPALGQSLLAALQENGFTEYAELLQGDPILSAGPNLIVYAPTNAALARNGNATVARRNGAGSNNPAGNSFSCVDATAPEWVDPEEYDTGSNSSKARLVKNQVASSGSVYGTLLDDPEWVNLGPGRNQTLVEKSISSASLPLVFTGLGASDNVTASDIPFDSGVIRPIDGFVSICHPRSPLP